MKVTLSLFDILFQPIADSLMQPLRWLQAAATNPAEADGTPSASGAPAPEQIQVSQQEQALWRSAAGGNVTAPYHAPGSILR